MPENRIIKEMEKNGGYEKVVFSLTNYKKKDYFDIRVFYKTEEGGYAPTKKGVCLPFGLFGDFQEGVGELAKAIQEKGGES